MSFLSYHVAERQAEGLGNDNLQTVIKVNNTDQILPFKNGTALPSPSQAICSAPNQVF